MQSKNKVISITRVLLLSMAVFFLLGVSEKVQAADDVITLRVCNWEEYIDLGDWDEEEVIELENGESILGVNAMYEDFEEWYYETYGKRVKVEYSCFGTNEDLYNQLTMGDVYDLVCPSDYMIMKLMAEDKLESFSEEFWDTEKESNYYAKGVSPYIKEVFDTNELNGESWGKYAAGYMWGVTGVLYNPEFVTEEEASTWAIFGNPDFNRQVTLKDNVRDTYFAILGYLKSRELTDEKFLADEDYQEKLTEIMNDVSPETIAQVQELLQDVMGNIYALETDSGKADIVTGKIVANYQWSGDAVYAMDLAEEDGVELKFATPKECTNLWFDGWVMLKAGIDGDAERKQAAEAFVNFLSRPDNAVRNMYYIGYTSAISGGEDDTVFQYIDFSYGAEDEGEDVISYPLGHFFVEDEGDEDYIIYTSKEQAGRQLFTQYPSSEVLARTAIMGYFDEEETKNINQMWINVRCYNIKDTPFWVWIVVGVIFLGLCAVFIRHKQNHYTE